MGEESGVSNLGDNDYSLNDGLSEEEYDAVSHLSGKNPVRTKRLKNAMVRGEKKQYMKEEEWDPFQSFSGTQSTSQGTLDVEFLYIS